METRAHLSAACAGVSPTPRTDPESTENVLPRPAPSVGFITRRPLPTADYTQVQPRFSSLTTPRRSKRAARSCRLDCPDPGSGIGTAGPGSRWIIQNPWLRRRARWPCDVITSHGGRGPGTDGGQVRGERRRARCADAEMRSAMSGEVENGDGKPVDPSLEGAQESAG